LPIVDLGKDTSIYEDSTIILDAHNTEAIYIWSAGENTQTIIVTDQSTYSVTVTDINGCSNADEIKITVKKTEKPELIIYNTFTPNGDGVNDTWHIKNIELYPNNTVEINNRNGNLVYKNERAITQWDGTYYKDGKDLPAATYYYIIDLGNGPDIIKGNVTIIR